MSETELSTRTSGWVTFAGSLMILAGIFQALAGLVAIIRPSLYYVQATNTILAISYREWGWIHFILGIVLILSALSLFAGQLWGRIVAVVFAVLSAFANFAFIKAYPVWSIAVIIIDVMIIYAVTRGFSSEYY